MLISRKGIDASQATLSRATRPTRRSDVGKTVDNRGRTTEAIREVLLRAEGEYREMPGLSLTTSQAARLWGLDHNTCELVLATLIERRVLRQAWNGTYIRSE